jgi:hypothetical protein
MFCATPQLAAPRPRSGCVESIGYCLHRLQSATRMRSGVWMLDTSMRIAPTKILLDRILSQAGLLDRILSHAAWAALWLDGALGTCRRPTRDSASLHPCRQAAYFLPCTRPLDACGFYLDRPRKRLDQGSRDGAVARVVVTTRAGTDTMQGRREEEREEAEDGIQEDTSFGAAGGDALSIIQHTVLHPRCR